MEAFFPNINVFSLWALICVCSFACNSLTDQAKQALDQHDLAQAENLYRQSLRENPQNIVALTGLGWTYHLAMQRENAAQNFMMCINLDTSNIECMRGRASVALAEGDIRLAENWIDKAMLLDPRDPELINTSAILDLSKGQISDAKAKMESLSSYFGEKPALRLGYAETLLRMDDVETALEQTEMALQSPKLLLRYQAMFWLLRARILLEGSARSAKDCTQKEAMLAWVAEAKRSMEQAEATGVSVPNWATIHRQILRRQNSILAECPDAQKSTTTPPIQEIVDP